MVGGVGWMSVSDVRVYPRICICASETVSEWEGCPNKSKIKYVRQVFPHPSICSYTSADATAFGHCT